MKLFSKILFLSLSFLFASQCMMADDTTLAPADETQVEYVVVNATIAPLREDPSEAAEQATQLLFGEVCEVIEHRSSWIKVRNMLDNQVGWVSSSMLTQYPIPDTRYPISVPQHPQTDSRAVITAPMAYATPMDGGAALLLTLGTRLPNYANGIFEVLGKQYRIDPSSVSIGAAALEGSNLHGTIVALAKSLLNTPYLWGGKNAMGLDCSGFTQVVYAAMGINLLRNAREQITQGELVTSLSDVQPGDLAFFDHADRNPNATRISHVGMMLSPTEIIHCSGGRVHIDKIDEQGIILPSGTRTHHLVQIKRYL